MNDPKNQREYERIPTEYEVIYRVPDTGAEGAGTITDMSHTGAQFVTDQSLEPGLAVSLKLPPPKEGMPALLVAGEVVRCVKDDDGTYAVACAYD